MSKSDFLKYSRPKLDSKIKTFNLHSHADYIKLKELAEKNKVSMSNIISNMIKYIVDPQDEKQQKLDSEQIAPNNKDVDIQKWLNHANVEQIRSFDYWLQHALGTFNKWVDANTNYVLKP